MKRGKKLLTYLFTIAFSMLAMVIFDNGFVSASNEFTCVDRGNGNVNCSDVTTDAYFVLTRYEVLEGTTTLEFPNTHQYNGTSYYVEEIASNAIVVVDSSNNEVSTKLNLTSLVLPQNLRILNDNSLKNISSIPTITLPTNLMEVGSTIFDDNASVTTMYLNHYEVNYSAGGGSELQAIIFEDDSFTNANLEKLICLNVDIYSSVIKYNSLPQATVALNYYFYASEKAAGDGTSTPIASKKYYVGDKFTDLPSLQNITGLVQLGWYLNSDLLGEDVIYTPYVSTYIIVPKFELKQLTFTLSSNKTEAKYAATGNLITIEPINITHELLGETGFEYEIVWAKNGNAITAEDGVVRLAHVKDTGTYLCTINYEYTYEDIEYIGSISSSKSITITPATLYVEVDDVMSQYGTYLTDDDVNFEHRGLLNKDKIDSYIYTYHNSGDISVGLYRNELKVMIQKITNDDSENVTNDYDIVYVYGDHEVTKKDLGVISFNENKTFVYGADNTVYYEKLNDVVYGTISNDVKVILARENGNNVGRYLVTGIDSINNENYVATFDKTSSGYVYITQKEVAINYSLSANTYDGKPKIVDIFYQDITGEYISTPASFMLDDEPVDEVIDAGLYTVIAEDAINPNYLITNKNGLTFRVNKANPIVKYEDEQDFVYTGEEIKPIISINNNEQEAIYTCSNSFGDQGDYCINSGIYTVNVRFEESTNYYSYSTENSQSIRLSISKYAINLNPKQFRISYGEKPILEEIIRVNDESMLVKYETNATEESNIGAYDIVRANIYNLEGDYEHVNYSAKMLLSECVGKVIVEPRIATLHYYGYSNLVYDGREKNVGVYLVDELTDTVIRDVEIHSVVDEGVIKNAGKYHVSSTIDSNKYAISNSTLLEFSVAKGTYDLSNIKFEDKKYILDFKKHSVEIEGELPEGVEVVYSIDGKNGNTASAFSHTVRARFVVDLDNYNPIEDMEATIHIDMSWLIIVIIVVIIAAGAGVCGAILYASYRREHPRKIKLKIKNVVQEDLAAKRVATSVKEVLGDEAEKAKIEEELAILENEDDLADDKINSQTFIERIYAASSELKYYYSEVKNELLSYEGITHSIDRKYEVFYHGTRTVAKLSICNGILRLYVNLDPQKYDKRNYNHRDMSKFECHEKTPLRINVNSLETLRHAKVFIRIIRKKEKLEAVSGFVRIDYEKFYTLKENFIPKLFKNMFTKDNKGKDEKK